MYNNILIFVAEIIMKFLNKYFIKQKLEQEEQKQEQEKGYSSLSINEQNNYGTFRYKVQQTPK